MSAGRQFERLFRGIVALEGEVNRARGDVGLAALFEDDCRTSEMLDRVTASLITAKREIAHHHNMSQAIARVRRGRR